MTGGKNKRINPEMWVKNYGDDLFAWAYHRTGKKALAEDLVQETFLSALDSLENFRGESSEKTWLFAILKNKITDYFRNVFTRNESLETDVDHSHGNQSFMNRFFDRHGSWNKNERPANWHESEENLLDDEEFRKILEMCLKLLPEIWLALITLRFLEEKKTPEICKELDITPSNLWVILHRSKLQLRACIEENFLD